MAVYLNSIGLCTPGLPNWPVGCAVLTGQRPYSPDEPLHFDRVRLPRNEARRASLTVRLALQAATEALDAVGMKAADCSAIFACSGGNTEALDALCRALIEPGHPISPNQFNNSVHNAPLGYWTIAAGSHQSTASVGAYDASFAAGLLDAVALVELDQRPVLLVAFDTPPPSALQSFRAVTTAFGAAWLLMPASDGGSNGMVASTDSNGQDDGILARLDNFRVCAQQTGDDDGDRDGGDSGLSGLESLRLSNPAARCLPLLRLIANRQPGKVQLSYLPGWCLEFHLKF
ncbi:MAG: hypothetical protein QG599_3742 [Pseudomonadota bacterium]|nr:hypothetical protein [Pseudomonadota bacterium]